MTEKIILRNGTFDTILLEKKEKNTPETFDIKSEIQTIVGAEWIIDINDSLEFSHPY